MSNSAISDKRKRQGRVKRWIVPTVVVLAAIQLIPITRDNPPIKTVMPAPANIQAVLKHDCYSCHSNTTKWPWYSHVAPISWLIASDVHGARHHLNFTDWDALSTRRKRDRLDGIKEELQDDDMPPLQYRLMHPSSVPTAAQKQQIYQWSDDFAAQLDLQSSGTTAPNGGN